MNRNKTIDWQKKELARAKMRMIIKKLLKKYKYPSEGQEDAVKIVIHQCEMWTDNLEEFENIYNENSSSFDDDFGYLKIAQPASERKDFGAASDVDYVIKH